MKAIVRLNKACIVLIAVISFMLLYSCSPQISGETYKKVYINPGDSTVLKWKFNNAEKVKVNWGKSDYNIIDSLKFSTMRDSTCYIVAYQSNFDSLKLVYDVFVNKNLVQEPKNIDKIIRGPGELNKLPESYSASDYFIGMSSVEEYAEPASLKVLSTIYNRNRNNNTSRSVTLKCSLLDKNGNFIRGLKSFKEGISFVSDVKCDDEISQYLASDFTEHAEPDNFVRSGINILLDNSAVAVNNEPAIEQIKDFIKSLPDNDEVGLTLFNQESKSLIKLDQVSNIREKLNKLDLDKPYGLNSLFKASTEILKKFNEDKSELKALVVIAYSADNSSLVYDANDVVNAAKNRAIPIPVYVIAIGDAVENYFLQYLSVATGGKFYHIFDDDLPQLENILKEIANSQRTYYEVEVPVDKAMIDCNNLKLDIKMKYDGREFSDSLQLAFNNQEQYSQYQSVALFDSARTEFSDAFLGNIKALAKVLQVNPTVKVELIGNSSKEFDNDQRNKALSELRATEVKNFLISLGANGDQIVTKGIGRAKPLYYLEQQNWQADFNRRVEVRWLAPSVYPYEIIAEQVQTEDDAIKYIDKWQQYGYKAYFDRFLEDDIPFYRIKLWGYSTLDDANFAVEKLKKKFPKIKFTVE